MTTSPQGRGLRRLTPEKRREIARLGGLAAQRARTAHRWTAAEASAASLKGWAGRAHAQPRIAPPPVIAEPALSPSEPRTAWRADSWTLIGRDGQILECRTLPVPGGFELCAGYPDAPLMYSEVYADVGDARRMLVSWLEGALAHGNFAPAALPAPEPHHDVA